MRELNIEELSVRQKLGMCMTGHIYDYHRPGDALNTEYALNMIRNRCLGSIWVDPTIPDLAGTMAKIREAADYPMLIFTDAESGIGEHLIGRHNALGCTGSEELAYMFGKVTAVTARQMGYNVVCNPILDMTCINTVCGTNVRSIGSDKYEVARLAKAIARGMHDGGVLTVGKHYPGTKGDGTIDSHMAEVTAPETAEQLLDYNLFPYLEMMKEDLLDGVMTQHARIPNVDPDYPASLSKKVIGLIRDQGFDGFAITDALVMMGVAAKFGAQACKGLSIANGNDMALTWGPNKEGYEAICESYDNGVIDEERLNEAVRRVLEAQHKTIAPPKYTSLTAEELEKFDSINRDSTYAITDEGVPTAISREGRHYFAVLTPNEVTVNDQGKVNVDTFRNSWYQPQTIMDQLTSLFPNSTAVAINEFPSAAQNMHLLERSVDYDDVIFITYMDCQAYVGLERLTPRIISLIQALQVTSRVSTVVHFGNPFVLEDLEHIPRVLIGGLSADSVRYTLEILAGMYPAKGVLTYDVNLK